MGIGLTRHWLIPALGGLSLAYAIASLEWSRTQVLEQVPYLLSLGVAFTVGYWFTARQFTSLARVYCALCFITAAVCGVMGLWGWTFGSNYLGAQFALGVAICFVMEWPIVGFGLLVGVMFYQSRVAFLALGVAAVSRWGKSGVALLLGLGLAALFVNKVGLESTAVRLGIWQDVINHMTPLGTGYGSFLQEYLSWAFRTNYDVTVGAPAHAYNDFLEVTFELGLGAIPLVVMIALLTGRSEWQPVILCFLVLGLAFFPLSITPVAHFFFACLGQVSRSGAALTAPRNGGAPVRAVAAPPIIPEMFK